MTISERMRENKFYGKYGDTYTVAEELAWATETLNKYEFEIKFLRNELKQVKSTSAYDYINYISSRFDEEGNNIELE